MDRGSFPAALYRSPQTVDRDDGLLAVESDQDPFPGDCIGGEEGFWTRQTLPFLPWTPSSAGGGLRRHGIQSSIEAHLSRNMHSLGATLEQLFVGVSTINDDPRTMEGSSHERVNRINSAPTQICSGASQPLASPSPFEPPQTMAYGKQNTLSEIPQTNHNSDDDEADAVSIGFPVLGASRHAEIQRRRSSCLHDYSACRPGQAQSPSLLATGHLRSS